MSYPNEFQKRTLWSAGTGLAIVLLTAILVGFIWVGGQILSYLQPVLVPLAVAGIIAYLLEPLVVKLEKHPSITRLRAVLIVLGTSLLLTATLGTFLVFKLSDQATSLSRNRDSLGDRFIQQLNALQDNIGARGLVDTLTEYNDPETGEAIIKPYPYRNYLAEKKKTADSPIFIDDKGNKLKASSITTEQEDKIKDYDKRIHPLSFSDTRLSDIIAENWQSLTKTALNWLKVSTKVFGFLGYLFGFLLVPVYLFYFLNESAKIKSSWTQYIPLKASKFKDEVIDTVSEINTYLISFFRGQMLVSIIDGFLVGMALGIFQLPYYFLIGLALAILGIIPFIGNILCMVPAIIIALVHFSEPQNQHWLGDNAWVYVAAVLAIFIVVQNINSLVTAPKIVGDSVGLHPMTVIFSILFWSLLLGGFLGALLAVPLTAAVKVLFQRYLWEPRITPKLPVKDNSLPETSS